MLHSRVGEQCRPMQPELTCTLSKLSTTCKMEMRIDTNKWCARSLPIWPGDTTQPIKLPKVGSLLLKERLPVVLIWRFTDRAVHFMSAFAVFTLAFNKFKDERKHLLIIFVSTDEMGMIVLFVVFTGTSICIAWSRSFAVPFTIRSSKRGRWVSAWSTRRLNTTTTWYRAWLPVPPLRPLTGNCAFNSTCISECLILKTRESE